MSPPRVISIPNAGHRSGIVKSSSVRLKGRPRFAARERAERSIVFFRARRPHWGPPFVFTIAVSLVALGPRGASLAVGGELDAEVEELTGLFGAEIRQLFDLSEHAFGLHRDLQLVVNPREKAEVAIPAVLISTLDQLLFE